MKNFFEQFLAADKILHGKYSFIVLAGIVAIMLVCYFFKLSPVATMLLIGGWCAGAAVEGSQRHDNQLAAAEGKPPVHEISFGDAAASAFGPTLFAILYEVAVRIDALPTWARLWL